ncbi:hypothetical protein LOD99_11253 [Oopsacas minuta]|uniref:Uncharacterized protein n=1 Tax=Oopsacas minuta TaxID=111878 RepID=A0AAV7K6F5_9METZ|nr:hypothetical protein LOD99_11253 [Oopsacas minuta]
MNIFEICRTYEAKPQSPVISSFSASHFYREHFRAVFIEQHVEYSHELSDDIIFYITAGHGGPTLTVARRESVSPMTDLELDWQATFYANLVLHTLEYTMICAVGCTNDKNVFNPLHKCTKRVYPSPSQSRMDKKGKSTTICYPHIYFSVDDYEQTFSEIHVGPDHRLAVEVIATNQKFGVSKSVFAGMVEYSLLRNAVDRAVHSRSTLFKKLTATFHASPPSPYEFVRMNGPKGKGHAEVAISVEPVAVLHSAITATSVPSSKLPLTCHVTYVELHVDSLVQDIMRVMDIIFPPSNVVAYFKKQVLLPHIWTGKDLQLELTPLQKACVTLQHNKVVKLLDKRHTQLNSGFDSSDIEYPGAGLTPLECCLKENACVLLSNYNPTKKTYRYHINNYISRRKVKSRKNILTALLKARMHIQPGWSAHSPLEIPWSILDKDETQAVVDFVDLSTGQVAESIAQGWINWLKNIHYTSTEAFFLNHLSPFYIRYPRCCMRYQFRMMAAGVKHGGKLQMFGNTGQLLVTLLDNALVFQAMLSCYHCVNGTNVHVPDFDWISQNLTNILETDFYKWKSIYRAMRGYMDLLLSESVVEFDNNLIEHNPRQLPGYVLTRFRVVARGLVCMDREENRHIGKLLDLTIQVIYRVINVFRVKGVDEDLEKLVCCIISALTSFRIELLEPNNGEKIRNCVRKLFGIVQLNDHIPFVIMRQAVANIPVDILEIYIPIIFNFLSDLDINLNMRSRINNENLLLTSISNHTFTFLLIDLLLELKVYPFTVNNSGLCFASHIDEFFVRNLGTLFEEDLDSLEFLKSDFPILKKPYSLKILSAQASGQAIEKFPKLADCISPQKQLFDYVKLHIKIP